jgi:hypothetical protein
MTGFAASMVLTAAGIPGIGDRAEAQRKPRAGGPPGLPLAVVRELGNPPMTNVRRHEEFRLVGSRARGAGCPLRRSATTDAVRRLWEASM